ncbi:DNA internalization-related competence protein ComEC/Rec2 [Hazenella sp. IB182357]|uniref:DNA internalization-related competence protein ComEC/Rec2 n=1 Tax=Polycladospora coralii TaxID=2771432 RepID=A0A926RT17_9BACL|nr:DNA internalization-related competence protein ComEC/Rec2 [Polycladospora coralii]MBD1371113.1 DNA internalization-related competence protein ComEC/Rec2 [Polycladospora coralii]
MLRRPFVWLACSFIIGVIGAYWSYQDWMSYMILFFIVAIVGGVVYYHQARGLLLTIVCLGFLLGAMRISFAEWDAEAEMRATAVEDKRLVQMTGEIITDPVIDGDQISFILRLQKSQRIQVRIYLKTESEWKQAHQLRRKMMISLDAQLQQPSLARNPYGFDYRAYLKQKNIYWVGYSDQFESLEIVASQPTHIQRQLDELRRGLATQIKSLFPTPYEGFIQGILLGYRNQVDPELIEIYQNLGIIHVLAISGLHVGVLIGILYFILKKLGLAREHAAWLVMISLPIYVILTGAGIPVVRAAIMGGFVLLSVALNRWKDPLSFLAIALLCQLIWNPYQLFQAGFQLSYAITTSLILVVNRVDFQEKKIKNRLYQAVFVTIVAQVSSFPFLLYHFNQFSMVAWACNLLFVPIFSGIIFPLAWLSVCMSFISFDLGGFIAKVLIFLLSLFDQLATWVDGMPGLQYAWATPSLAWFSLYAFAILYIGLAWNQYFYDWKKHVLRAMICFVLVMGSFIAFSNPKQIGTKVTFLDVGQGDCTVIETQDGKVILVDGGGKPFYAQAKWKQRNHPFEVGHDVVFPFLKASGINKIDYLIMTHGDYDHIGGLQAIAERIPITTVIRNNQLPIHSSEQKLMATLRDQGSSIKVPQLGLKEVIEPGIEWKFLHPSMKRDDHNQIRTNNQSIVFMMNIYSSKLLMTGDIEVDAEKEINARWQLPRVDVLKVAHHGSATSTQNDWVNRLRPQHAIISVGQHNRYQHPSPEVLTRLTSVNANIWRTDEQGAIVIHFDETGYNIQPNIVKSTE